MSELTDVPIRTVIRRGLGDRIFRAIVRASGVIVLLIMLMVGGFLLYRAWAALGVAGWSFLTEQAWEPDSGTFGIAAVLPGTIIIALIAVSVSLPLAAGTALYISEYAPARLRRPLISLVDLMAAVPSVVFGLWGFFLLQPELLVKGSEGEGLPRWLATWFGWIPLLAVNGFEPGDPIVNATVFTSSSFIAGLVVGLMITPIACSVMREVFTQAPQGEREGALALGATRWGMIRAVVLPYGKGGIIGGTMLGLGRALGETIAVYMIISQVFTFQPHILERGGNSVSSLIALRYGDSSDMQISGLMAAGLALFAMTLAVNYVASMIISRSRSGAAN